MLSHVEMQIVLSIYCLGCSWADLKCYNSGPVLEAPGPSAGPPQGPDVGSPLVWEAGCPARSVPAPHKLECSFKWGWSRRRGGAAAQRCHTISPGSLEIDLRGKAGSSSHRGEMKHAAGPGAADEPGRPVPLSASLLLSLRDLTHRAGSCLSLRQSYYCLIGSQLSERESPHWIWTCAIALFYWMRPLHTWCLNKNQRILISPSSHILRIIPGSNTCKMLVLVVISLAAMSSPGECFYLRTNSQFLTPTVFWCWSSSPGRVQQNSAELLDKLVFELLGDTLLIKYNMNKLRYPVDLLDEQ